MQTCELMFTAILQRWMGKKYLAVQSLWKHTPNELMQQKEVLRKNLPMKHKFALVTWKSGRKYQRYEYFSVPFLILQDVFEDSPFLVQTSALFVSWDRPNLISAGEDRHRQGSEKELGEL